MEGDFRNAVQALNTAAERLNGARTELAAAARRLGRVEQAERANGGARAPGNADVGGARNVPGGNSRIIVHAPGIDRATLVNQARAFGRNLGVNLEVYSATSGRQLND